MDPLAVINESTGVPRIVIVVVLALGAHLVAMAIRRLTLWVGNHAKAQAFTKVRTIINLIAGTAVFGIYFAAVGAVLAEFDISLTAYFATASVIGLAVAFGSQNIVQDVITGLTVILSDLIEINDMVEISGQTGIVKSIGMRFTVLQNSLGAEVYIPNRTLASMINYPRGYVRCLVDVDLVDDEDVNRKIEEVIEAMVKGVVEQFPAILRAPIEVEGRRQTSSGKHFVRIKFRIWPGRGAVIETTFKQELLARIRATGATYTDGMVAVNYEVDQRARPISA
ncbi:MAG: mechanosensitive ion channel [Pseudomonadales bacterium]|nr:mechanosensitive ion channel [Pseudomonadales bacterium]